MAGWHTPQGLEGPTEGFPLNSEFTSFQGRVMFCFLNSRTKFPVKV